MKQPISAKPEIHPLMLLFIITAMVSIALVPLPRDAQLAISVGLLSLMSIAFIVWRDKTQTRGAGAARTFMMLASFALYLRYLVWRGTDTLPLDFGWVAGACGLVLFLTEGYCFVHQTLSRLTEITKTERVPLPLPADSSSWPTVDVYIPTYDEDPEVVRATVIAATQMNYPAGKMKVYVLDDGGTDMMLSQADAMRALAMRTRASRIIDIARRYGATYLTRERNEHAKAGNLNHALRQTQGEFIVVLDCDHVPVREFITRTLGLMLEDPKRFLVQTPHHFVSPDPLERNLSLFGRMPAENELFYHQIQPGLDAWGATLFCGSAALLRRSALEDIGGFATGSITEDAETTLVALSHGYTSAYLNEPLVSGLQPETFKGFIMQRARWSQGMLQIFFLKKPWKLRTLDPMKRLLFTNFALYWLFSLTRLLLLFAPVVTLLFGIHVADAEVSDVVLYGLPALLASAISANFLHGRLRWPFVSLMYEVVQSVHLTQGLLGLIRNPRAPKFQVTPKGEVLAHDFVSSLAKPFYALLALNVAALVAGAVRFIHSPAERPMLAFVSSWAAIDFLLLLCALGTLLERRQRRAEPRVGCKETVVLVNQEGRQLSGVAVDVSASGARLRLDAAKAAEAIKKGETLTLRFPDHAASLACAARASVKTSAGGVYLRVEYQPQSEADERQAIAIAFGSHQRLKASVERRQRRMPLALAFMLLAKLAFTRGGGHLWHLVRRPFRAAGSPSFKPATEK